MNTDRLFLLPATLQHLDAIVSEDWAELARHLGGIDLADRWMHFPEAMVWMRNYLHDHPDELGWWAYLVVHRHDARLIGTCGYKGPPTPDGDVEIGYEIADDYQGRGLATEVAAALITRAFAHASVSQVLAHTLPEENASVAVLRKLGFVFVEEIFDLEDGTIWKWRLMQR